MYSSGSIQRKYSDEQLLEYLRRHEKNGEKYKDIAKEIGTTGDNLSKIISKRIRVKTQKDKLRQTNKEEVATLEQRKAEARAEMERQAERQMYNKMLKESARTDAIVEAVIRHVTALPEYHSALPTIAIKRDRKPEESILVLSDSQIGQWTRPEETGGLGDYDFDIFRRRAENLRSSVFSITDLHQKSGTLSGLNIFLAGDMLDGEAVFPNQSAHIEDGLIAQLWTAVDTFAPMFESYLDLYPKIHVFSVNGNHGRSGRSKKEPGFRFSSNWDQVFAMFLRERLRNNKRIEFTIPNSWFLIADILGWRFLIHHYDVVKSWMNLPYYGLDRYDRNFSRVLQAKGMSYDYMIGGHFHNYANVETPVGEWIINGAWPGASYYSLRDLAVASRPSQLFLGVHPDHGLSWRYKVDLEPTIKGQ